MQCGILLGVIGVLGLSGCTHDCTSEYEIPTYIVVVTDAKTGKPICDATLTPRANAGDCRYGIPIGSVDSATGITAEHAGYASVTVHPSTQYSSDDCGHAIPVGVTIGLTPN